MLTDKNIKHITDSWESFAGNELNIMLRFYSLLFKWYPHVRYHFPDDMNAMAEKLWKTIDVLVGNLRKWDDLVPVLHELGRFHRKQGIANEDYVGVVKALVATIKQGLGDEYTDEEKEEICDAWKGALVAVSRTMMSAPVKQGNVIQKFFRKALGYG